MPAVILETEMLCSELAALRREMATKAYVARLGNRIINRFGPAPAEPDIPDRRVDQIASLMQSGYAARRESCSTTARTRFSRSGGLVVSALITTRWSERTLMVLACSAM